MAGGLRMPPPDPVPDADRGTYGRDKLRAGTLLLWRLRSATAQLVVGEETLTLVLLHLREEMSLARVSQHLTHT